MPNCHYSSQKHQQHFATIVALEECITRSTSVVVTAKEKNNNITIIQIPQHYHKDSVGYPSPLHYIYVESLLSDDEVEECLKLAVSYGSNSGKWDQPDLERHTNYATCDFAVEDAPVLEKYLFETINFKERLWNRLMERFDIPSDHLFGFIDLFCVNYVANDDDNSSSGTTTMDQLEAHRDGSIVSFSILLSPPNQFEGGGTFFEALRHCIDYNDDHEGILRSDGVIQPQRAGDVVMHSGKLLHGAEKVTRGQRTVLVGFIDMAGPKPGTLAKASTEWGRLDVAEQRYQRQLLLNENKKHGSSSAYKHKKESRKFCSSSTSCLTQIIPPISDAGRMRAEPNYQRKSRLAIEDQLLRSALLDTTKGDAGVMRDEEGTTMNMEHIMAAFPDITIL